jgi:hypothetical protein
MAFPVPGSGEEGRFRGTGICGLLAYQRVAATIADED